MCLTYAGQMEKNRGGIHSCLIFIKPGPGSLCYPSIHDDVDICVYSPLASRVHAIPVLASNAAGLVGSDGLAFRYAAWSAMWGQLRELQSN